MPRSGLTPLQHRIVGLLADLAPAATLSGGAALVGVHGVRLVDTPHEILVNKLCALLGRSELRDLSDVAHLLGAGGDLERALVDAPRKDRGFSALTLAWVLRGLAISPLPEVAGLDPSAAKHMTSFRDELVVRLTELARPGT